MNFSCDFITINVNGLRNDTHRHKLFHQLKSKGSSIIALQETHSQPHDENRWPVALGGGTMLFSHGSTNARGVAIFISKKLNCQLIYTHRDSEGRVLVVVLEMNGVIFCIANIYAPNLSFCHNDKSTHELFFYDLNILLDTIKTQYNFSELVLLGDFNMIIDAQLDAVGGNPTLYPKSIAQLNEIANTHNMIDIFRELNPGTNLFTYSPGGLNVRDIYRRLDYIFVPETWRGVIKRTILTPAIHSDHRIVQIEMCRKKLRPLETQ